jgi:hypothetical protein
MSKKPYIPQNKDIINPVKERFKKRRAELEGEAILYSQEHQTDNQGLDIREQIRRHRNKEESK